MIGGLAKGLVDLCKKRGVTFVQGKASFQSSRSVLIEGSDDVTQISYDKCILAAGSRPLSLPGVDFEDERLMSSTGALQIKDIPKKLLVVGAGVIALELGTVYASMGSEVTVVELMDSFLPAADKDLSRVLHNRLKKKFKAIHLGVKVTEVKPLKSGLKVRFEGSEKLKEETFDRVLCAIGRKPNTDIIGIENTAIQLTDRGLVKVDKYQRTADPAIYAIGDLVAGPMLAHKASYEGRIAAEVIVGKKSEFDATTIPGVIYTNPELAWCGLTEKEAKTKGIEIEVAKFPWAASGRALSLGQASGLTKLIIDPQTERILGVGIVGPHAGELISEGMLAVEMAAVVHDLGDTIHPHPSLSETISASAEVFSGSVTDIYVPKKGEGLMVWQGFGNRKFPRLDASFEVKVSYQNGEKHQMSQAKNIGIGGICLVCQERLGLFEQVSLDIPLSGQDDPIQCAGTVMWTVKVAKGGDECEYDLGIEFVGIKKKDKDRLVRYIDSVVEKSEKGPHL